MGTYERGAHSKRKCAPFPTEFSAPDPALEGLPEARRLEALRRAHPDHLRLWRP
ncbi:MAG: hypothetical protein RLZZ200_73, partial [Pseudomonadota bacterium]